LSEYIPTIVVRVREDGIKSNRTVVACQRFVESLEVTQRISTIAVSCGKIRLERNRLVMACERLLEALQISQGVSAIGMGRRELRFQENSSFITGQGFFHSPKSLQREAALSISFRVVRL